MNLLFGLFVAWMASWIWPGCVESARCRRRGCRECFIIVQCDAALLRMDSNLPQARAVSR